MSRHGDFKTIEASRPDFKAPEKPFIYTKTPNPEWIPGSGASNDEWKQYKTVSIDPHGEGRLPGDNYKLMISGIVPRPIGFISTVGENGERNLAPMSYTQIVNHDPPIITVGFSGGTGLKDSTKHLLASKECTVNIISDWFIEAANYCSINAPTNISEWSLSGLTPIPSHIVAAPRVAESAFSIECKLVTHHNWTSPTTGKQTGTMCILEGVYFHVREDAINEARNIIDIGKLRPVSRLGGVTYSVVERGWELPRPDFAKEVEKHEHVRKVKEEANRKEKETEVVKN